VLVAYTVLRLRADATGKRKARPTRKSSRISRARAWLDSWRRSPSLDDDPVLWREWHRGRPTRLARITWGTYFALAFAGTAWGISLLASTGEQQIVGVLSGFQATFGLLLVSIGAPTALAEERARGSLDVLMTTPLSTDRIVLAKWWGAYRILPALACLPAIGALAVGFAAPQTPRMRIATTLPPDPLGWIDRVAFVCLPTALLLAQGAVVTSFGLLLATWMRRLGRAIAATVACYVVVAVGWLISVELLPSLLRALGLFPKAGNDNAEFIAMITASFCPLGAQVGPFLSSRMAGALDRYAFYIGHVIVFLFMIGVAYLFLALALASFNRAMGRMPARARRAPRPPRRVKPARGPHAPLADSRQPVALSATS
jgi:ABC-type transport system involved in multi-copper enzyme maturation permease subunit